MLRYVLPLMIALIACTATAQESNEKLKGLLWEVSGKGITKKGYLYGTMHVPEKLAFNLSDSFFIALRTVDMVALETDHDRWQEFTEMLDGRESELFNIRYGGFGNRRNLDQPNLYHSQFEFSAPTKDLLGAMLSAKPRLTNEFLYRSNSYRQDYEEDTYLDLFIFQAGRKLGKTVIGLETLEGSYESLVRAQMPDEDEDESRQRYFPGQFSRQTMEDAYRDQDLTLLDSLNKMSQPGKNFQRWMLDERNTVMVNGIDSILQSGKSLFSAVGAAHLPGETGLIHQLRERGYTVRPVQFTSEHFKREKEAIEAMRYPVKLERRWAADSTWSVEAPGRFYQTFDGMGLEQQLYADMSNGAYYAIYRVHTYGMWNGQSPAYMAERIDSLIYEFIPGKIQLRKRLDSPFPGHEITTRTRRGDILRYKVFSTPMEVFVFATGGNGDYAAGPEGSRFINSVEFHRQHIASESKPTLVRPPHGGFQVEFPAAPVVNTTTDKKADRYMVATVDPADSTFFMLYRATYHDWEYIEEDSFELNIIGEKVAEQFTKGTPESALVDLEGGYPAQDISFRSDRDSARYRMRLIIDGPQYYLLACRNASSKEVAAFFNSFHIEPTEYPQGYELLQDTALQFEAMVPKASLKPPVPFLDRLQQIIQEGFKKNKRNGGYYNGGQRNQMRILELPLQGEAVSISSFQMLNTGFVNTLDSFQAYVEKMITDREKMAIRKQSWDTSNDTLLVGNFLIEDTNSTRGIRARILLTPGRLYTLSATVQLDQPNSVFVDKVFDTFTPKDTTTGKLPFGRRDLAYLQDIYSADSLIREKALERLETTWFFSTAKEDFSYFRAAIDHPDFPKLKYLHRQKLLRTLSEFNSPEALQYVLELSNRYTDSLRYRQILLVALAEMKTRPALKALVGFLQEGKMYLTGSAISEIFDAMNDTLDLTLRHLPVLLRLSELTEYQEEVTNLLANAIARDKIKPKAYRRMKSGLVREAYRSIGQQLYQAEMKRDIDEDDRYLMDGYDSPYGYGGRGMGLNMERNLRMLAPFLRTDKAVQELFDRAVHSPDKEIQVIAMSLQMQQGIPVRPKTLRAFADDDHTRYTLYQQLATVDRLKPYLSWFADTVALVRSMLYEELDQRNDYGDSNNGIDSVRFVSQHRAVRYNRPAVVFFFEVKKKKEKDWMLAYVNVSLNTKLFGFTRKGKNRYAYDDLYWQQPEVRLLNHLPESEKAEYIRKKIGEIRFANRARYRSWGGGDDDFYFEE